MGLLRQLGLTLFFATAGCAAEDAPCEARANVTLGLPDLRGEVAIAWTMRLDTNVPSWEERVLRDAVRAWEAEVPCAMTVTVERGKVARGADDDLPAPFTIEVTIGEPPTPGAVGWAKTQPGTGSRIILLPNVTDDDRADFPRVAQHELGHAFIGDEHGGYVMAAPAIAGARVSEADGQLYAARWCTP